MKIISPLANVKEVEPLIKAGANMFYCGLVHKGEPLNDRPNNKRYNFETVKELANAVKIAKQKKVDIYLTLNIPVPNIDKALEQCEIAESIGIKGVVAVNFLLMKKIKQKKLNLEICASCLTGSFNSQSINFFQNLGVKMMHLPRQLGLDDLDEIRKKVNNVELSVFGLDGMCINTEAFCALHSLKEEYFVPCYHFKTEKIFGDNTISKKEFDKRINMPDISCGLCGFKKLNQMKIGIKIEGRGSNLKEKIQKVEMVKSAVNSINKFSSDKKYYVFCKKLFFKHYKEKCKEEFCYF